MVIMYLYHMVIWKEIHINFSHLQQTQAQELLIFAYFFILENMEQ